MATATAAPDEVGRAGAAAGAPLLELREITKHYPGCLANDRIDLSVRPGEVHALLGENGAGKSTLVKVIYGVVRADSGEIYWRGEPAAIHSPAQARQLGIGMVFQHFNLFETLTVTENIALGLDRDTDLTVLARQVAEVSERYGLPVHPHRHVHGLSVGERQRIEIVRCLLQDPKLLIMDEPTSVLTPQEADRLFETLRRLAQEGVSILYISHKLHEIKALCDVATVLRGGRVTATCDPSEESEESLARMMIGRDLPVCERSEAVSVGDNVLVVEGLSLTSDDPFGVDLTDIHLTLRGGEIVGLAGITGNGQRELMAALSGERLAEPPFAIRLSGIPVGRLGPASRRRRGLAFVPEERLGRGAVPDMSVTDNALLTGYGQGMVAHGFLKRDRIRARAEQVREAFNVVCSGPDAEARSLSGGNLQKFIIGREVLLEPRVLIAAYPTWGVDVGSAAAIRQALLDMRKRGAAVLVASEDLDELFEISDRIIVISDGRLSPSRDVGEADVTELGQWMSGGFGRLREGTHRNGA